MNESMSCGFSFFFLDSGTVQGREVVVGDGGVEELRSICQR
jgi:hypothetical protein